MKWRVVYLLFFLVFTVVLLRSVYTYRIAGDSWKYCVASDGRGYYAYLPATFIYGDYDWNFIQVKEKEMYGKDFPAGSFLNEIKDHKVNQYFAGTAVMMMPFFLLAEALSPLFGYENDGYSNLFQYAVALAAVFYCLLGLIYLKKALKNFGVSDPAVIITLTGIALGTNLFYYASHEPSMSHVYSFAAIAAFIYYAGRLLHEYTRRDLLISAALFGLIILIRPVNGLIILFLPFLAGGIRPLIRMMLDIWSDKKGALMAIPVFTFFIFLQLLYYYLQTGKFFVYSYSSVGFNFSDPHILDILFSYRKGLFIYTPVLLLAIIGLTFYLPASAFRFISWLCFFLAVTFFLSSWEYWWYGGSYGLRAYIEFFPCIAFPLAGLFHHANIWRVGFFSGLVGLFVWLNFFQMDQYRQGILMADEMNHEKYWAVFLRNDPALSWILYNQDQELLLTNTCIQKGKTLYSHTNDFESRHPRWLNTHTRVPFCPAPSGDTVSHVNPEHVYSETFQLSLDSLNYDGPLVLRTSVNSYSSGTPAGLLVISIENAGKMKVWNARKVLPEVNFMEKAWQFIAYSIRYDQREKGDILRCYVMKEGPGDVYIDNFSVTLLKSQ